MAITCARAEILHAFCLFAFLCLLPGSRSISITNFSVPKSVAAGENAELLCEYELEAGESEDGVIVKWWWTPQNEGKEANKQLYQRIGKQQPNPIKTDISTQIKEGDSLVLLALQPRHAGTFECEASVTISEARRHQDLVVHFVGIPPELNVTSVPDGGDADDEEDALVQCSSRNVAPLPQLTITIGTEPLSQEQEVNDLGDGWYDVYANATVTKSDADGKEIRCELFYEDESISHPAYFATLNYEAAGVAVTTTEPGAPVTDSDNATDTVAEVLPGGATCRFASPLVVLLAFFSICFYL